MMALAAVFLALSCSMVSLWENPPDGRTPRQRRAGIFHRLLAAALRGYARGWCFVTFKVLDRLGLLRWVSGVPSLFMPRWLVRAIARAEDTEARHD